jgi:hypothetical protein
MKRWRRSAKSFARIYGSPARVRWVANLPCSVVGCTRGPCDNAHTETGGMGRKADYTTIAPLCPYHHREQHFLGCGTFEARYGVDMTKAAEWTEVRWQAHNEEINVRIASDHHG